MIKIAKIRRYGLKVTTHNHARNHALVASERMRAVEHIRSHTHTDANRNARPDTTAIPNTNSNAAALP